MRSLHPPHSSSVSLGKMLADWRRLSLAFLLLSFVPRIFAEKCSSTTYEWWRDDIRSGNRAFLVEGHGRGGSVRCLSKGFGSNTELLDPVIESHMNTAGFDQYSKMPCDILGGMDGIPSADVDIDVANEKKASTTRRRLLAGAAITGDWKIQYFASTDGTCTGIHSDLSSGSVFTSTATANPSCHSYADYTPSLPSTWPTNAKYAKIICSGSNVVISGICSEGCSTCQETATISIEEVVGKCVDQKSFGYPDYKIIEVNVDANYCNADLTSPPPPPPPKLVTDDDDHAEDICVASRPDLKTCKYPMQDQLDQYSWGGIAFKISRVNNNCTTPDEDKDGMVCHEGNRNELQHNWKHSPVYGGDETSCETEDGKSTRFSSGVVFSQAPLPYDMKYRVYMFSSETERLAALDDTRNAGLQYAREMKGENGCDAEIVYEFFPKPGGGLMVELSQTMGCTTKEGDECKSKSVAIADSTSAYISNDTNVVVVQVEQSTLRESQYLPVRSSCDQGTTTTIKMSSQFICAATGERINISSIKMSQAGSPDNPLFDEGGKREVEISRDPSKPTTFQVDPANPSDCWYKDSCGGWSFAPDFVFRADAASAPESCGSFYWDPLIYSVAGDGMAASVKGNGIGNSPSSPTTANAASAGLTGILVALMATIFNML